MHRTRAAVAWPALFALGACTASATLPPSLSRFLAEAPADSQPRLWLAGDRIVAATAPLPPGPGSLPPAVRTMSDAVASGGVLTFVGREWNPRGDGYRIEKRYSEPAHQRSVLITPDGRVLERAHTWPIADVPQAVMATALRSGPRVDEAWIVSGPAVEEYWSFVLRDRADREYVVRVGLDGAPLGKLRRTTARLDT